MWRYRAMDLPPLPDQEPKVPVIVTVSRGCPVNPGAFYAVSLASDPRVYRIVTCPPKAILVGDMLDFYSFPHDSDVIMPEYFCELSTPDPKN
jgi:hypothetical protein